LEEKALLMKSHFLRAEWNNLVMANYTVPKNVLLPFLPAYTELDFFEGEAYVSLVGFMFLNTKVLGFSVPMHENFEEVNLRFYVKHNDRGTWKKGVVFIKEIVPKRAISFVANHLYGESYSTMRMKHYHLDNGSNCEVGYEWKFKGQWNKIGVVTDKRSKKISDNSCESFFADHYWGYTKHRNSKTYEYHVEHLRWETLKVLSYHVDCDFGTLYGEPFAFLNNEKPKSVLMTKGSEIRVEHKTELNPSYSL
jgi:uncharacterized protein YqjF (DUF2071 family)